MLNLLELTDETTWPSQVQILLDNHYGLFLNWEKRNYEKIDTKDYDSAIYALQNALMNSDCVLLGYHCTRITEEEIGHILENGMQLPNREMLQQRIDALVQAQQIDPHVAEHLKNKNEADAEYRANKIWFCFYPPHLAGQRGIERFFRSWGGEALYNSHEWDMMSGPILAQIGIPCLIQAYVPIASLAPHGGLETNFIRQYLKKRGFRTREDLNFEGKVIRPITSEHISGIIQFPDKEFIRLTKCNKWVPSLDEGL